MTAREELESAKLRGLVKTSLDEPCAETGDLARRAHHSRSQFFRLFRALIHETPAAMRRRLLLERSGRQLSQTGASVTEIAFDAGYGSLEAFTRAFRRAFRISPSLYRRMGATYFHLPAPNGIHFYQPSKGNPNPMDLFDIFNGNDGWQTRRLLEHSSSLTDDQLDRPLNNNISVFPWSTPDQNLRDILERIVQTKEVWTAALTGGTLPNLDGAPPEQRTPAALLVRFEKADADFHQVLTGVRDRGAWDDTFVDALCEPPETFTFGAMFAHVITFNAYRLLTAMDALRKLGVKVEGFGCPTEYEASLAKNPLNKTAV